MYGLAFSGRVSHNEWTALAAPLKASPTGDATLNRSILTLLLGSNHLTDTFSIEGSLFHNDCFHPSCVQVLFIFRPRASPLNNNPFLYNIWENWTVPLSSFGAHLREQRELMEHKLQTSLWHRNSIDTEHAPSCRYVQLCLHSEMINEAICCTDLRSNHNELLYRKVFFNQWSIGPLLLVQMLRSTNPHCGCPLQRL